MGLPKNKAANSHVFRILKVHVGFLEKVTAPNLLPLYFSVLFLIFYQSYLKFKINKFTFIFFLHSEFTTFILSGRFYKFIYLSPKLRNYDSKN